MNKVYIIIPLLGLIVFGGFYMSFTKSYEEKIAVQKAKAEEEKKAKAKQEILNREKAIKDAIEAQARRKAERDAIARKEEEEEGRPPGGRRPPLPRLTRTATSSAIRSPA
jgi:ATPase subunit of ABC transporter with duplicated ATPase domains